MATRTPGILELKLRLGSETGRKLKAKAAAIGKDAADYAAELIEDAITQPSLDEMLAPVREQFARSGMGEDELSDFLEDAKHRRRVERRKKAGG
jgi:hypothetical protein